MRMALEGIKVLDLASMWAAPSAAMYLCDQGADVIKVEPPQGDEARRLFTHPKLGNESPSFLVVNRNKRGIVVDLRQPEGLDIVKKLAQASDVVVHNFRPKFTRQMGLTYDELAAANPGLIYVELSAYGKKGPYADRPGYDVLFQALSGMLHRRLPDGTPITAGVWAADCSSPIALAYGVALALLERQRTGRGQKVETSLLNMAIAMQFVDLVKPEAEPPGERAPATQPTFAPYRCADGRWIIPVALSDKEWARLCTVLGLPHLIDDPRFATAQARTNNNEIFSILEGILGTRPRDEWLRLLEQGDVPCAPVLDRDEVFTLPQVVENEMMVQIDHPTAGRTVMMDVPIKLSANPPRPVGPSPLQGQHTDEVLGELGYAKEAIADLRAAGVIA